MSSDPVTRYTVTRGLYWNDTIKWLVEPMPPTSPLAVVPADAYDALRAERDHLRAFLSWESEPDPRGYAWCCWCQASHPVCDPHVNADDHALVMDWRLRATAEIAGLKAEVERLLRGEFTDTSLRLVLAQHDRQLERVKALKRLVKEDAKQYAAVAASHERLRAAITDQPTSHAALLASHERLRREAEAVIAEWDARGTVNRPSLIARLGAALAQAPAVPT